MTATMTAAALRIATATAAAARPHRRHLLLRSHLPGVRGSDRVKTRGTLLVRVVKVKNERVFVNESFYIHLNEVGIEDNVSPVCFTCTSRVISHPTMVHVQLLNVSLSVQS